jgi:hypothetical protein
MIKKITILVFLTSSLFSHFGFANCRADVAFANAKYMLLCKPENTSCKCPEQFVSTSVDFHLSSPLNGNELLRCEPPDKTLNAEKSTVQQINLAINQVTNKINSDNCENRAETASSTSNLRLNSLNDTTFDLSRYIEYQTYRFNDGCGYN